MILARRSRANFSPIVAKLLALLADRDRLVLVPDVLTAYSDRLLDYRHVVRAEVTTAEPLTTERLQDIQRSLSTATGLTVDLSSRVDPDILGGIVVRVGNSVLDASIRNRLEQLRKQVART